MEANTCPFTTGDAVATLTAHGHFMLLSKVLSGKNHKMKVCVKKSCFLGMNACISALEDYNESIPFSIGNSLIFFYHLCAGKII